MTRHGEIDLSGVNLYNENGGVVQGQICGQGLITKLLRNKKGGANNKPGPLPLAAQNSLVSNDGGEGTTLCLNPLVGNSKRTRHGSRLYENMNMFSNDTESCSSDDNIVSEATSSGSLSAVLDELQAPAFVAQFDPMQLFDPTNSTEEQEHASSTRKLGSSWSASLPAVLEEDSKDSQSEQGSQSHNANNNAVVQGHGGIWRNILTPTLAEDEEDEDDSSSVGDEEDDDARPGQKKQVLLESDRIKSPISITSKTSSKAAKQFQLDQKNEGEEAAPILPKTPNSGWSKYKSTKRAKEASMKEAVDRRIKQVMEEEFGQGAGGEVESSTGGTADGTADEEFQTLTSGHPLDEDDDGILPEESPSQDGGDFFKAPDEDLDNGDTSTNALHPAELSAQMQDMLRQQQVTLKEMSLQNYQYRKELSDCQEMFGKWRLEKEKQQSTISDLVKEKEAYASEANFLRNEMSSIRKELEALRKEAQLHQRQEQSPCKESSSTSRKESKNKDRTNEYQSNQSQSQLRESPFKGKEQQSPYKESSPVWHQQDTRGRSDEPQKNQSHRRLSGQPQQQSPFKGESQKQQQSPYKESSHGRPHQETRRASAEHLQHHRPLDGQPRRQQSPLKSDSRAMPAPGVVSPPPPPLKTMPRGTPPRLDYIGANKPDKPLVSKLKKSTPTDAAKKQGHGRSVKFHDPPKNKEWTLFPNQMHDDDRLNNSMLEAQAEYFSAPQSRDTEAIHGREGTHKRDEPMVVCVKRNEADLQIDEEPTPIAANGRSAMVAGGRGLDEASTSVYKYRLQTIQKNRQQRVKR